MPTPIHVPPSCFLDTSAVFSFATAHAYCSMLPVMGFATFLPAPAFGDLSAASTLPVHPRSALLPFEAILTQRRTIVADRPRAGVTATHSLPWIAFTAYLAPSSFPSRRGPMDLSIIADPCARAPGSSPPRRPPPLGGWRPGPTMGSCLPLAFRGSTLRPCSMRGPGTCATFPPCKPRSSRGLG